MTRLCFSNKVTFLNFVKAMLILAMKKNLVAFQLLKYLSVSLEQEGFGTEKIYATQQTLMTLKNYLHELTRSLKFNVLRIVFQVQLM